MTNIFYTYALKNGAGKIYIGHTVDLDTRLKRHNGLLPTKSASFTIKQGGPWNVFHIETFSTRAEAIHREKQLKTFQGRCFLREKLSMVDPPAGGL